MKLLKLIANLLGYKIVMIKISKDRGTITMEGDPELRMYTDTLGYLFKKGPLQCVSKDYNTYKRVDINEIENEVEEI